MMASAALFAAPQITVIGQVKHSFSTHGLQVNAFHFKKDFSDANAGQLVKSIKNSKLVVAAESATILNAVFSSNQVKNALTEFFKNGGTFYLWVPSWSWMNSRPLRIYGYFNYCKVILPVGYKGFGKGKTVVCKVADDFAAQLKLPAGLELRTPGANNRPLRGNWKTVLTAPDGSAAGIMQEEVFGKGSVFVSYLPLLHDRKADKFIACLVKYAYGDLLKK